MSSPPRKLRVLHVMHQLTRGGIETWFLGIAKHLDRDRFQLDVLVHTGERAAYDEQIRALGCGIHPCLEPRRPWAYARNFLRIVREHGPYDIIHTHCHHWNGCVLLLAWKAGVRVRIAHSRAAMAYPEGKPTVARRLYAHAMDSLIRRFATHRLAVSTEAGLDLFGPSSPGREWEIVRSAIELAPFESPASPTDLPSDFPVPVPGPVVASIARFDPQKNHRLVISVFEAIASRKPEARLVLIGAGPAENQVRGWVNASPFRGRIHFLGDRPDVPALLHHAVDLVLLPSHFEGLPRVAVEAQAAGVPVLMSDKITREAIVVQPAIVYSCALSDSPDVWAERAIAILDSNPGVSPEQALGQMKKSDFNIVTNTRRLEDLYDRCVGRA